MSIRHTTDAETIARLAAQVRALTADLRRSQDNEHRMAGQCQHYLNELHAARIRYAAAVCRAAMWKGRAKTMAAKAAELELEAELNRADTSARQKWERVLAGVNFGTEN